MNDTRVLSMGHWWNTVSENQGVLGGKKCCLNQNKNTVYPRQWSSWGNIYNGCIYRPFQKNVYQIKQAKCAAFTFDIIANFN